MSTARAAEVAAGLLRAQLVADGFDEDVIQETICAYLEAGAIDVPLAWCRTVARRVRLSRWRHEGKPKPEPEGGEEAPPEQEVWAQLVEVHQADPHLIPDLIKGGYRAGGLSRRLARWRRKV